MKKLILIAIILSSCNNAPYPQSPYKLDRDFQVIELDSCEYIVRSLNSNNAVLAHKGNCKYCKISKP